MSRLLAATALIVLAGGISEARAQFTTAEVPVEFFGAQRGRVVYRPSGAWRMRYGRGLTPQGAQVITTGIQTIAPLLIPLLTPTGTQQAPNASSNGDQAPSIPGGAVEKTPEDPVLDALAKGDISKQQAMTESLDRILETSREFLTKRHIKPADELSSVVAPQDPGPPPQSGPAPGNDWTPVPDPAAEAPTPEEAPTPVRPSPKEVLPEPEQIVPLAPVPDSSTSK